MPCSPLCRGRLTGTRKIVSFFWRFFSPDPVKKIAGIVVLPHCGGTVPWKSVLRGFGLF